MEGNGPIGLLAEETVEDDQVKVEVGIEGGAETVPEGDGAELCVGRGARRTSAAQRAARRAQLDAQDGAGERSVAG